MGEGNKGRGMRELVTAMRTRTIAAGGKGTWRRSGTYSTSEQDTKLILCLRKEEKHELVRGLVTICCLQTLNLGKQTYELLVTTMDHLGKKGRGPGEWEGGKMG